MIGQYLSNTNEIDIIHILQNILQLNKFMLMQGFHSCSPVVVERGNRYCTVPYLLFRDDVSARVGNLSPAYSDLLRPKWRREMIQIVVMA